MPFNVLVQESLAALESEMILLDEHTQRGESGLLGIVLEGAAILLCFWFLC